jgi:hypothetical protein
MALAISKKIPAPLLSQDNGILSAMNDVKFAEIIGTMIMTGKVPMTNPIMIPAAVCALPDIALAASAEDSVMQGKNTVTNPMTKRRARIFRSRPVRRDKLAATRPRVCGAHTISLLTINDKACMARIAANSSDKPIPVFGRSPLSASPADPIKAPIAEPISVYEITRPKLYNRRLAHRSRRLVPVCVNRPHTKGPHMAAQCHDMMKLNQAIDSMVAASTTSTECRRCSK